ncbi:ankyrin repeat-containing domain protein [Mycena rebaudengoi]|nr:ankyrin repeat-containing domain protein [Mycena rebaudengoi]
MDPVSAVGLVASILQLVAAAKSAIDLGRDAVNATKDQRDLLLEVQNLTPLLEDLKYRLQQPSNQSRSTRIWLRLSALKTVLNAWLLLDTWDVGQQQEKNYSQIRQDQYRLLTEVKNLAQNEHDFHDSAGSSLLDIRDMQQRSHDQISKTLSSSSNTQRQDNYRILTEVRNVAQDQREVMDSAEREKIIDWLSPLNFFARHADIFGTRQEGTGRWLLEDPRFRTWLVSPGEIIWCSGIPGAGKTVLSPSLDEVCDIVRSTVAEWSKVFIVVDALDEYPEARRRILLDTLAAIGAVSLLLTSRPNIAPKSFFPTVPVLEIRAREEDIRRYIDAHIQTLSRLSKHVQVRPELRAEIESKIISNVDGMQVLLSFLLARLHLDSLATKTTVNAVRDALKNLPEDLEHTYNEAMDRIEAQNKDNREIARRALIWVANAKRPLSVHELCEALAIKLGATTLDADDMLDIEFIVSVCAGLLIVDQAVRLVHHTTQDYIDRVQPSRFPQAQTEITSQCLTYISFKDFRGLRPQNTWNLYYKHKLLPYAILYCLLHAAGEPELLLQERIISFLSNAHQWRFSFFGDGVPRWYNANWPLVPSKLWVAAIFDLQEITKHLLEFDQSISKEEKESALLDASYWNCPGVVRLLINHGANLHAAGGYYGNALQTAAAMGHVSVAQELIANGINVNIRGGWYSSALIAALERGHEEVAELLIQNGADVNAQGGHYGNTLQAASAKGSIAAVQLLLDKGADVNEQGGHYGNALQAASAKGSIAAVQLLLDKGADVNVQGGHYGTALNAAFAQGNITVMQLLLDNSADMNLLGRDGETALQAAVAKGKAEVVQLLLDNGADMNLLGRDGETTLQAAVAKGKAEVVQLLLDNGADMNLLGRDGETALQAAVAKGKAEVVQLLLNNGADVNLQLQGGHYRTALQAALAWGNITMIQLLLDNGADMNLLGRDGETALQAASAEGEAKVVQLLLDNGADVNFQGGHYGTALQAASAKGEVEVVQLLLDNGTDVNMQGGDYGTALQAASAEGKAEVVQLLLKHAADVSLQGGHYGSVLQAASATGRAEVVQLLVDHGTDVNVQGGRYGTALQAASAGGHLEVVQVLLENGADVNTQGGKYGSALHAASAEGKADVVQLLLEHGANVNLQGEDGTALQAATLWNKEVVSLLLDHGANVNLQGGFWGTALQEASARGEEEVVQLLLDHGADVNLQGGEYGTALQAALAWGNISVVQLLLKHGADVNVQGGHYGSALQAASEENMALPPIVRRYDSATSVADLLVARGVDMSWDLDLDLDLESENEGAGLDRRNDAVVDVVDINSTP